MTAWRAIFVAIGTALAAYGGWLLVDRQDNDQVLAAVSWLVSGVLLHDAAIAPLTILIGLAATRWLPPDVRAPATVALVVLGPLTLLAVPVLSGFGEQADNPSNLDRPYWAGWSAIVVLAALAVAGRTVDVRSKRRRVARKETDGPGTGGR